MFYFAEPNSYVHFVHVARRGFCMFIIAAKRNTFRQRCYFKEYNEESEMKARNVEESLGLHAIPTIVGGAYL